MTEPVHSDDEDSFFDADPYQGYPTTTEVIDGDVEDNELSVLMCKAITQEISPLPGVFRR